ncbi:NAD(P)/FAD-dependent oxidoreductase [Nocardia jiangxiensis]|nr:NAD(P)/FAD-dependent oxidoreductase [Nocardia jiangxiensis]
MVWDVVVVGAGAAGLSAATACAQLGLTTRLIERLGPGGELMSNPFPLDEDGGLTGQDAAGDLLDTLDRTTAALDLAEVEEITHSGNGFSVISPSQRWDARFVVLATGSEPRKLDIPGGAEWEGRGVSYCAPCDGPLYAGSPVAVVAADRWAPIEVRALTDFGIPVTVIADSTIDDPALFSDPERDVTRVTGNALRIDGADKVEAVVVDTGTTTTPIPVAAVFASVGRVPTTKLVAELVERDVAGRVLTGPAYETKTPGLYAIGDVRAGNAGTAAAAIAEGKDVAAVIAAAR